MRKMLARDVAALVRCARRRTIAAAAIASATLAPLMVSVVLLAMSSGTRELGPLLATTAWGSVVAAVLGGMAVAKVLPTDQAARADVVPRTVGYAALAGAAYFPVCVAGIYVAAAVMSIMGTIGSLDLAKIPMMLLALAALLMASGIVGGTLGALFGTIFVFGTRPAAIDLATPTHDLPERASMWAARMLGVATIATCAPALMLEGEYCRTLFFTVLPSLGIVPPEGTDAAWTRYPVFAAVPLIATVAFALDALVRRWTTARCLRAIERGEHRDLKMEDVPPGSIALPLRHSDRFAEQHSAIVAREASAPYRSAARPLAIFRKARIDASVRVGKGRRT